MKHLVTSVVVALVLAAAGPAASETTTAPCVEVVDGDTLVVETAGGRLVVHLAEVDAPELDQPSGAAARDALATLALAQQVTFTAAAAPTGGEVTARVTVAGEDLGLAQVAAGLAWTQDTHDEQLAVAAIVARSSRVGLWQEERPTPPWAWRTRTPPPPTPTPVVVTRSLREAGKVVDLKENADGRAVIAGLPVRKPSEVEQPAEDTAPDDGRIELQCSSKDVAVCLEEAFQSNFARIYPGDSPGGHTATLEDQGNGAVTVMFQGQSAHGSSYAVGSACSCAGETCNCVMQFAPLDAGT